MRSPEMEPRPDAVALWPTRGWQLPWAICITQGLYLPICKMGLACKGLMMGKGPQARNPCPTLVMLRSRHALMASTVAEGLQ